MNTLKMAIFGFLLTATTAFSQNNDFYNYNRLGRSNRGIPRDNSSNSSQPSAEQIEKNKANKIDAIIAHLKAELTLDELQAIVIRNEITASIKNIDIVSKKEISQEDKSKEIKALTDRTEVTINSYLNAAQKEKYIVLISESKSGKKGKKDKKTRGNAVDSGEPSEAKDKTVEK
jgi:hypothetical protein